MRAQLLLCVAIVASTLALSHSEAVERATTISCSVTGSCTEGWTLTPAAGDKVLVHGVLQDARLPVVHLSPSTSQPAVTSGQSWLEQEQKNMTISRRQLLRGPGSSTCCASGQSAVNTLPDKHNNMCDVIFSCCAG